MDSLQSTTDQLKSAEGRRESFGSQDSQTAKEYEITSTTPLLKSSESILTSSRFIESQIQLEADAREVLPYVSPLDGTYPPQQS